MLKLADRLFLPLFLLTFFSVYTSLHVDFGFGSILAAPALVPGLLIVLLYAPLIMRRWLQIGVLLACALIPTVLATFVLLPISRGALSFGMLTCSMLIGLGVYIGLCRLDERLLAGVLGLLAFSLIVLGLLELHTGFKEVSDAVRTRIYVNQFLYTNDSRDLSFYGWIRPKVFAQEPSLAAKAAAFLCFGFLALARSRIQWLIGISLFAGVLYIFRSPEVVVSVALVGAVVIVRWLESRRLVQPVLVNVAIAVGIVAILMMSLHVQAIAALIGGKRGAAIAAGAEGSTVERILLPPQVFLQTLQTSWVGFGLGAKQTLDPLVHEAAGLFPDFHPEPTKDGSIVWGDGVFDLLIGLGPFFAAAFGAALSWLFRARYFLLPALLFTLVFFLDVGAPNPRNWFYFAVVAATFELGTRRVLAPVRQATPPMRPRLEPRRRPARTAAAPAAVGSGAALARTRPSARRLPRTE